MNLLNYLSDKEIKQIRIASFNKGSTIFKENDLCKEIGILVDGLIKISSFSHMGKEIIYNIISKNQVFGNNLVFSSEPFYKGDVIAAEDSKIAFISQNELVKILQSNDKFLIKYLEIQSDFGKELNLTIKLLSIGNAKDRLLFYLSSNNNQIRYSSITELAKRLNLERETLSRTISTLCKEKAIIKTGKEIKIIL